MSFVAGPYTATYNGLALGQFDDGFETDYGATIEDITSDMYRAVEDGVYQGVDVVIRAILNEPNAAGVAGLIWPYDSTFGTTGAIGRLMTSLAKPLVLTACAGTTATPATYTVPRAVIYRDRLVSKHGSVQRKIPVVIAALPLPDGGSSGVMGCAGGTLFSTT